jgi:hypothetical protein
MRHFRCLNSERSPPQSMFFHPPSGSFGSIASAEAQFPLGLVLSRSPTVLFDNFRGAIVEDFSEPGGCPAIFPLSGVR